MDKQAQPFEQSPVLDPCLLQPPREIMKWLSMGKKAKADYSGFRRSRRWRRSGTSLQVMFEEQGGLCSYCAQPMTLPRLFRGQARKSWPTDAQLATIPVSPTDITRDHIHPKSGGGPGIKANFAAVCRLCNQQKADLPLVIFMLARVTNTLGAVHRRRVEVRRELEMARLSLIR